ncbi:MAG: glycoside hydrolase family 20 zincin-like fold domain-containing protein [Planctomycetota bacterium]
MKTRPLLAALVISIASGASSEEFIPGGDFESQRPLADWTVQAQGAKAEIQRLAGRWIPVTVTFNSEDCSKVIVYIGAYAGPTGRCWVDNVHANGFTVKNPSFEEPTADGKWVAGWGADRPGEWMHVTRKRASDGKVSVMYHDASYAAQMIRLSQVVDVHPNTEYSYTYDFYMDDDFYGAIRCSVIAGPPAEYRVLGGMSAVGGVKGREIDDLIADRSQAGYQQCNLTLAGGTATLSRTAMVPASTHLEAGIAVKTKDLKGKVTLSAMDEASGKVLAEASLTNSGGRWERIKVKLVSASDELRFRLSGEGEGTALLDGAYLSRPLLRPAVQSVQWAGVSSDFALSAELAYVLEGDPGDVLTTGLAILRKDLAKLGPTLAQEPVADAPIVIAIGDAATDAPADRSPEGYYLKVDAAGVRIAAQTERGAFYGIMTLVQLLASDADGKPVVIGSEITDWPDLPWRALNRGSAGLTPEWMARRKLNVAFHVNEKEIPDFRRHAIMPIPHDNITHYPLRRRRPEDTGVLHDPNMAEGVGETDELTLRGETPVEFSGRNVLRTTLTDVIVRSLDGKTTYELDKDFRLIEGEIGTGTFPSGVMSYDDNAKPFAVARVASGRISDGELVKATYEHVPAHSGFAALCLAEPAPQEAIATLARQMVAKGELPYIGLHVSEAPAIIGKGPRCQATGKNASELLAAFYEKLDRAVKEANPACRIIAYADDYMPWQHSPRSGLADVAEMLPKDAILHCWDYAASQAVPFNAKCAKLWTGLGHEFLLMGWYDYTNLRTVAAAALWARSKGMPCLGTSSWAYNPDRAMKEPGSFIEETAACAWRVPRPGENGYIDFEAELTKIGGKASARTLGP